jgi:hypothetical protein
MSVTYTWTQLTEIGSFGNTDLPSLRFTDAQVAAGSFSGSKSCPDNAPLLPCTTTGDGGVTLASGFSITNGLTGYLREIINVTFNPDGTLSGSIFYNDQGADFNISGVGFDWSGHENADRLNCFTSVGPGCLITGYWTDSPALHTADIAEPASWLLLAGPLMLLTLLRPRRRTG